MKEIDLVKNKDTILGDGRRKVKADLGISDENLVQKIKTTLDALASPP